jgi:hypothetical protein
LDRLRAHRLLRRVLNLQPFPLLLWERFVVGHFGDEIRNFRAEAFSQIFSGHARVFDCVME